MDACMAGWMDGWMEEKRRKHTEALGKKRKAGKKNEKRKQNCKNDCNI